MPRLFRTRGASRLLLLCAALLLTAPVLRAAKPDDKDQKLYQRLLRASVWINLPKKTTADGRIEILSGSGSLIDARHRLVVTNYHVVRDKDVASVWFPLLTPEGVVKDRSAFATEMLKGIPGQVIARDKVHDLALIQLEVLPPGVQALHLAAKGVELDDRFHSLGNPGESKSLWVFRTSHVQRITHEKTHSKTVDGFEQDVDARLIYTDVGSRPGESGGPLVNEQCELVGVIQAHQTEKTGDKESDHGVFIDLSEVKTLLEHEKFLPKTPPATVTAKPPPDEQPDKVKPTSDKSAPPAEDPEEKEQTAARRLKLAKMLVADGKADRARERYQEILKQFPRTKAAEEAKRLLEEMDQKDP